MQNSIIEEQNGRKQTTITTRNVQRDVLCRRLPSSRALTSWSEHASVAHEVGPCDDDDHGDEGGGSACGIHDALCLVIFKGLTIEYDISPAPCWLQFQMIGLCV